MISIWAYLKHKRQFAGLLAEYPFFRVLIFSVWFRLACVGFLLLALFFATMLPRIYLVTPSGFLPEIKISGFDAIQAWSLSRTAHNSMASGRIDDGVFSWKMCLMNNPGSLTYHRQMLKDFQLFKPDRSHHKFAIFQSFFLLRLSMTNRVDLELVTVLFEQLRQYPLVEKLLMPYEKELNSELSVSYLKSLFHSGNYERFKSFSAKNEALVAKNPVLQLYQAAYDAAWGDAGKILPARQKLEEAKNGGSHQVLAHTLQLPVSMQLRDLDGYSKSLNKLVLSREDTPSQHVRHWLLLLSLGKKELAIKEAQAYPFPPTSPEEVIAMSNAYFTMGLKDVAAELAQRFIPIFADDATLWISYANLLLVNQSWDPLLLAAVQIRQNIQHFPLLEPYSYLLEGLAYHGQRRYDFAEQSFTSMLKSKSFDPQLGCSMAELLLKNGYSKYARDLLWKLKNLNPNPLVYWPLLFSVAHDLKDDQLLFNAAETVYAIDPKNWIVQNNYAAALIILRKRPEEAVKLTLPFLLNFPESNVSKINHSMALMQNQRYAEAETILKSIVISRLNDNEKSAYNLAMVELLLNKKEWESAKLSFKLIDTNQLFPSEKLWLREAKKSLFPTNASITVNQ